jgi:anti-repressor protein
MQIAIIEKDRVEISSREIAELTGKEHRNVKRDIENALGKDALKFEHIYLDSMNRQQTEYILPKNIALGIVSGYSFDLRMKIINRLDELEQNKNIPLTYEEVMQNALMIADKRVKELEYKIKEDKPLTDFGRIISNSNASIGVGAFAKVIEKDLNISFGRNTCFKWLRDNGYLTLKNEPIQRFINQGIFDTTEHHRSNGNFESIDVVTLITGKGQKYLFEKIKDSNNGRV